jgi:endonuclease/exonuclease/phosphatase family metal-dependent hydrolase
MLPIRCRWLLPALATLILHLVPVSAAAQARPKNYLLCFWNVENLFDDKLDRREPPDREFDEWFTRDKQALSQKLDKIRQVLLAPEMNDGKGPDIIALAEVETARAAELVQQELNKRLKDPALHYKTVVWKNAGGKRSISTAVITRLKVKPEKTRLLGSQQRILEVVIEAEGQDLVLVASHWTARVSEKPGAERPGSGRFSYAETIFRDYTAAYKNNPKVRYVVCGDFNDDPTDRSVVEHLRATGELKKVLDPKAGAVFYNPFADKFQKGEASHYEGGWRKEDGEPRKHLFDQIVLSPALLDAEGWSYKTNSARVVRRFEFRNRVDRFGGPSDRRPFEKRGASDHFPVTVELRVGK